MNEAEDKLVEALIKDPKREKPEFIANPNMDKLISVMMRLAMENAVLRDRIVRQEQLVVEHKVLSQADFETYDSDKATLSESQNESFELIRAIAKDLE